MWLFLSKNSSHYELSLWYCHFILCFVRLSSIFSCYRKQFTQTLVTELLKFFIRKKSECPQYTVIIEPWQRYIKNSRYSIICKGILVVNIVIYRETKAGITRLKYNFQIPYIVTFTFHLTCFVYQELLILATFCLWDVIKDINLLHYSFFFSQVTS